MAIMNYFIKIKKKVQETKDSVSFIFEIPNEYKSLFHYTPAQFLTFEFQIKEKKLLRSYSLSSCPLLNEELKTTVKRVKRGVISNYMIDHLKEGDILLSRKPAGRFFKPPKDLKPKHYFLFAGGSGITPLFSIIKTILTSDPKNKINLFYANKDESSIIYHKELQEWSTKYKEKFKIVYILSQEKQTWCDIYGRLERKHLEKYFSDISVNHSNHLYYLCGPIGFMQTIEEFLTQNKVKNTHFRKESFFSATLKKSLSSELKTEHQNNVTPLSITETSYQSESQLEIILKGKEGEHEKAHPKTIRAFINEEEIEISAEADIPILEQLLSAGYSPPFSCLSGSCMSCLAVLKKGRIIQEERGILEDENLKNHEILTCQAKPESRVVEVDYDS